MVSTYSSIYLTYSFAQRLSEFYCSLKRISLFLSVVTISTMSTDKSKGGEIEYLEMKNATVSESYEKERNLDSIEDTKPGPFVWLCATATAIGGSLFGC